MAVAAGIILVGWLLARASGRRALPLFALVLIVGVAFVGHDSASAGDSCPPATTTDVGSGGGGPTSTTPAPTTVAPTTIAPSTTIPFNPEVFVTFTPATPPFCNVVVSLAGFLPNTSYTVVLENTSTVGPFPGSPWTYPDVTTDGTGAASFSPFTYSEADPYNDAFGATVDGVSSGQQPISC